MIGVANISCKFIHSGISAPSHSLICLQFSKHAPGLCRGMVVMILEWAGTSAPV
jgi:hypothetical protein